MELGEIKQNSNGTLMKIIKIRNSNDIDIEFLDEHHFIKKHNTYVNFRRGNVKNPYDITCYGFGYIGDGHYSAKENKKTGEIYNVWRSMMERCYNENKSYKYPAYYGNVICSSEWFNFQTFAEWYEQNKYECEGKLHLDKDILYPGNKVYSPYHCLLVPQRINMLFLNKGNKKGLPNGIRKDKDRYTAIYNTKELGSASTIEEAFELYARYKKAEIIKVANEYKETIPQKVYEALLNYEVRIENDKNYTKQ